MGEVFMSGVIPCNASFWCTNKKVWWPLKKWFGVPQEFYDVPELLKLGVLSLFIVKGRELS